MPFDPDAPLPVPYAPPREWFESTPEWFDPKGPLIQIDSTTGRVAAIVAPYGECILDGTANCWTPPVSKTQYEYAHVGSIVTEDGSTVRIANIGGGVPHANLTASSSVAADHYANTASRRMIGRYVDSPDQGGVLFLGSMWPGSTGRDMVEVLASALSGDWRWIQSLSDYEMVGAQLVNNPGFRPVPEGVRQASAFVAYRPAMTASTAIPSPVIGEWRPSARPAADLSQRLDALAAAAARVAELAVADETMPLARTAAPRRRPRVPGSGKVVDGDGDGRVYDNTPRERPATPAEMKAGKLLRQRGGRPPRMDTRAKREAKLKQDEAKARRQQDRAASKQPSRPKPTSPPKIDRSLGDGNVKTSRGVRRRTWNADKGKFDYVKPETGERPKPRAQVRAKTYKGKEGFEVSGTDAEGRKVKMFFDDEAQARATADEIKAGETFDERGPLTGKPMSTADSESGAFKPEDAVLSEADKAAITPTVSKPVADKLRADFGEDLPGVTGGTGTKADPLTVSDVDTAVKLIRDGKYHIKLDRPDEVSTLLDRLQAIGDDAYKKKEKAPLYDLCRVTVPGTNLFCPSAKVEERIDMPQFATDDPVPGSMADNLPRNDKGEVDLAPAFFEHLQDDRGVSVTRNATMPASHLRASQYQLNGAKVAGMMGAMERGQMPPGSIIVTSDGYVVDGHHRWAATVGLGLEGGSEDITVTVIDADIVTVLEWANQFTRENGSLPKAAALRPPAVRPCRNCRG